MVYKGEVYISLVHDIFVELDELAALEFAPDMNFDVFRDWESCPITGRLSPDQTASIQRTMVIHWLDLVGGYLSDHSTEESEPDVGTLIGNHTDEWRFHYESIVRRFPGASSRCDLYLDFAYFDETIMGQIFNWSAGKLLKNCLGQYRFMNFRL